MGRFFGLETRDYIYFIRGFFAYALLNYATGNLQFVKVRIR